jgi:site-specific DNA-cytosine methylase
MQVPGIAHARGGRPPFTHVVLDRIKAMMPGMTAAIWLLRADQYLLPTSRPRVFILGIRSAFLDSRGGEFPDPPSPMGVALLSDMLDSSDTMVNLADLTPKQRANRRALMRRWAASGGTPGARCAVGDLSRAEGKVRRPSG